jgi:HSP20 family protein
MLLTRRFFDENWDPFREVERLRGEMDRLFSGWRETMRPMATTAFPLVDLWTSESGALLSAELPGVAAKDLEISVLEDTVTIKGKRATLELGENDRLHRQERFGGEFVRTIQLPFRVDADKVEASYEHGVLELKLARPAEDQPRRIAIKAKS